MKYAVRTEYGDVVVEFIPSPTFLAPRVELDEWTPHMNLRKESVWDRQEGGSHYKDLAIQPTEYITKNGLNFVEGNIIKYVTRYRNKNGLEDLKKARHYLDILISEVEQEDVSTRREF